MSASGHAPRASVVRAPAARAQSRVKSNCWRTSFHSSQKSSEMRHSCAFAVKKAAFGMGAGPGEMLSTIGRPVRLSASRSARISGGRNWWLPMSSALTKSTPHAAYSAASPS